MLNFFGKKKDKDPKKALEDASNALNKGVMGKMTHGFLGKDFADQMNQLLTLENQAVDFMQSAQDLAQNGADGTAEVISITDTGKSINMSPVAVLVVKVTPAAGVEFQATAQVIVPRLAIPRVGDTVKIKYNPADPSQLVIV